MTIVASKSGQVTLGCEGITVDGHMCDAEIVVKTPGKDPETKQHLTKAARNKVGRTNATEKGWRVTLGADECPKVHSQVPKPLKAKERVDKGAPPCQHVSQTPNMRTGVIEADGQLYPVCGDPGCRAKTLGHAYEATGVQGVYISDSARIAA